MSGLAGNALAARRRPAAVSAAGIDVALARHLIVRHTLLRPYSQFIRNGLDLRLSIFLDRSAGLECLRIVRPHSIYRSVRAFRGDHPVPTRLFRAALH